MNLVRTSSLFLLCMLLAALVLVLIHERRQRQSMRPDAQLLKEGPSVQHRSFPLGCYAAAFAHRGIVLLVGGGESVVRVEIADETGLFRSHAFRSTPTEFRCFVCLAICIGWRNASQLHVAVHDADGCCARMELYPDAARLVKPELFDSMLSSVSVPTPVQDVFPGMAHRIKQVECRTGHK